MPGLMEGVRVLDLTHHISGPYCTRMLATLGADVIKVERPQTGDPIRLVGAASRDGLNCSPEGEGVSTAVSPCFLYLNSSKKSLTLDLKTSQGREIVKKLAAKAQVVVENFAPGTMEGLGLGYSQLSQVNPALVMTSISNYGQTGPHPRLESAGDKPVRRRGPYDHHRRR